MLGCSGTDRLHDHHIVILSDMYLGEAQVPLGVMGVLNVTPDSFSDAGRFVNPSAAIERGRELIEEGAAIIDVGGESTRPGATAVAAAEEVSRVVPVVEGLVGAGATISVDTSKLEVAEAALDAGAAIVNDVTALRAAPDLADLCADRGATVVLMHAGDPLHTMPTRLQDLVLEVKSFLAERVEVALAAGIEESRIWVDPGIGFGKVNPEGNVELLRRLDELCGWGFPVLVGTSRKSFIGRFDGSDAQHRLGGTIASCLLAAELGASVLRVHDVAPVVQALRISAAIRELPRLWVPVRNSPLSKR